MYFPHILYPKKGLIVFRTSMHDTSIDPELTH